MASTISFDFSEQKLQSNNIEKDRFQKLVEKTLPHVSCERHSVTTDDHYQLTIHRLVLHGNSNNKQKVFLQHGLLESSVTFIIGGTKSIAYNLLTNGYDVWLGNNRGNEFTQDMFKINSKADRTEPWSFHDMGIYDIISMLSYVYSYNNSKIIYIGHSQGTAQFIIAMSTYVECQKLISKAILLSPAIALKTTNLLYFITKCVSIAPSFLMSCVNIFQNICPRQIISFLGKQAVYKLGFCTSTIDNENAQNIFEHIPSGSTHSYNFSHWFQILWNEQILCPANNSKTIVDNQLALDKHYPIEDITIPIAVIIGEHDNVMDVDEMQIYLRKKLKNLQNIHIINGISHADVTWNAHGNCLSIIIDEVKK